MANGRSSDLASIRDRTGNQPERNAHDDSKTVRPPEALCNAKALRGTEALRPADALRGAEAVCGA
jgi:hypothetical protein